MLSLWYESPAGETLNLMGGHLHAHMITIEGTGIPPVAHQVVTTPNRDGAYYLETLFDERFITIDLLLNAVNDLGAHARETVLRRRREMARILNPRDGLGTLYAKPYAGSLLYEIPAILDGDLRFGRREGRFAERMTISFRCPNPYWKDSTERTNLVDAGTPVVVGGLSIPMDIPMSIVGGSGGGGSVPTSVLNRGDVPVYPRLLISGTATGPSVSNLTTGKTFSLPGLSISGLQVIQIDMYRRTVTLNDVNVSSYRSANSVVWDLVPGGNNLSFDAVGGRIDVLVLWNDLFVGI
jgi:hypothetical protein